MGSLQAIETVENRAFQPYSTATQDMSLLYSSGQSLSTDTHWINDEQASWTIGCYYAALAEGYHYLNVEQKTPLLLYACSCYVR